MDEPIGGGAGGEAEGARVPRALVRLRGESPGPTLVCVGGVHGNEPAGVAALTRVAERLSPRAPLLRGEFLALAGNLSALAAGTRFVAHDLNRAWSPERIARLRGASAGAPRAPEDREQLELLDAIEEAVAAARGPVHVLDLHTTSGSGGAFTTFGDTLANRAFAAHIPAPMVLGLEEQLEGTLQAFLCAHGLVTVLFEAGQHEEPEAVDRAEASVWIALEALGILPTGGVPEAAWGRKLLHRDRGGLPRSLEMRYRHPVRPGDGFRMDPGWRNFQRVESGEAVARDAGGPVVARERGRLLMPLYQAQGEDGFFLVREFTPAWLYASVLLRLLHADRVAHFLPGVRRHAGSRDTVIVDKRVARWYALQLFHLLGFRREEDGGHVLVLRRRRWDAARRLHPVAPRPEALE